MPSAESGSEVRRNFALNCWPWVRSLTHSAEAAIHSPAAMVARMAYHGHDIAVASCLGTQHTEAILGVVICDALDQPGQYFVG